MTTAKSIITELARAEENARTRNRLLARVNRRTIAEALVILRASEFAQMPDARVELEPLEPGAGDFMPAIYIVGEVLGIDEAGAARWDFLGAFTSHDTALDACRIYADELRKGAPPDAQRVDFLFVAPATLGERVPLDRLEWPGLEYPAILGTIPPTNEV